MNARLNHPETLDQDFTVQLGNALHLTPRAADEWLGSFLVRYTERRHAAAASAAAQDDPAAGGPELSASSEKSCKRAAA